MIIFSADAWTCFVHALQCDVPLNRNWVTLIVHESLSV
nr:hypothetical protein [Streptomyces sp. ISL-98]